MAQPPSQRRSDPVAAHVADNVADNVADWARRWRTPMLRFAQLHIQPKEDAEDAVQEALAAALAASADAPPVLEPRSYLFGILKHKITDRLRQRYRREQPVSELVSSDLDEALFDDKGHWHPGVEPSLWQSPEGMLASDQFFAVVDACVHKLPSKPARVFSMKELLECEADEICATLGMSKTDYWQCMSRARKQLQVCLTQNWFDGGEQ
ncbi:sigma-70 family RNA polymerase sigma factor [Aquabacterium sp. UBA2148]|uniref:sigma-70 family RNA polymerase sigma factor n=1 Tax=Aquabacterium sp. UBA2148 TaxID=1946042 RepID=UPI0025797574|nr:sigma-70 family RNA polymerase sigma factor [Aquabacterium sp. UBA2148]